MTGASFAMRRSIEMPEASCLPRILSRLVLNSHIKHPTQFHVNKSAKRPSFHPAQICTALAFSSSRAET